MRGTVNLHLTGTVPQEIDQGQCILMLGLKD